MWPVSLRYLDAVRHDHVKVLRVVHNNLFTGVSTVLADESDMDSVPQVEDGTVTIDATSNVRRKLDLTLSGVQTTWDTLNTVGAELVVSRGIRFSDQSVEWVPLGVFTVDTDAMNYGSGGTLTISAASDRWGNVQRLLPPTGRSSVPSNAAWQEIQRLIEGGWNAAYPFPGWATLDKSASTKVGAILYQSGDREAAVLDLTQANALEAFFDAKGLGVLRPVPQLTTASTPVFTIDAGDTGVLLDADRTRDRTRAYNVIVVTTSASDVTFLPQEARNDDPNDQLSTAGPLKYKAIEWSSPSLRNSAQARAAGKSMLGKATGVAQQLQLSAIQNDALDAEDVISVVLPQIDRNTPRPSELHIIDTITLPLAPSGVMTVQTRSTVPSTLGG